MATVIKDILVDVVRTNVFQSILAKQYDIDSRFLHIIFAKDGCRFAIPTTSTVAIVFQKPDDSINTFLGTVNEDGTANVPIPTWALTSVGFVRCEVSVYDNNTKLTTAYFTLDVQESINTDSTLAEVTAVSSSSSLTVTVNGVQFIRQIGSGEEGSYVFTRTSSQWTYSGSAVNLADYGIVVSGTPASGDTITVSVEPTETYDMLTELLTQCGNLNIQMTSISDGVQITLTKKDGTQSVHTIHNGETGPRGPQGPAGTSSSAGVYYTSADVSSSTLSMYYSDLDNYSSSLTIKVDDLVIGANGGVAKVVSTDISPEYFLTTYIGVISGGSAGFDLFIVNITYSEEVYSADKTVQEILTAAEEGKMCVALFNGKVYPLSDIIANTVYFDSVYHSGIGTSGGSFSIGTGGVFYFPYIHLSDNKIRTLVAAPPSLSLSINTTVVLKYTAATHTFTITAPAYNDIDFVTGIIFTAVEGQAINAQVGSSYAIHYSTVPTFTAGKTYEISYRCLWLTDSDGKIIISGLWNEV